jgi:predicted nucleotidyltransferase
MMSRAAVEIPEGVVAEFCRRHHIRQLALFGSVLRADFRPDSDIDVLVEFERGRTPGLITMAAIEIELSGILGRKVDLRTAGDLSRYFRDEVVRTAEVKYSAG